MCADGRESDGRSPDTSFPTKARVPVFTSACPGLQNIRRKELGRVSSRAGAGGEVRARQRVADWGQGAQGAGRAKSRSAAAHGPAPQIRVPLWNSRSSAVTLPGGLLFVQLKNLVSHGAWIVGIICSRRPLTNSSALFAQTRHITHPSAIKAALCRSISSHHACNPMTYHRR